MDTFKEPDQKRSKGTQKGPEMVRNDKKGKKTFEKLRIKWG